MANGRTGELTIKVTDGNRYIELPLKVSYEDSSFDDLIKGLNSVLAPFPCENAAPKIFKYFLQLCGMQSGDDTP